MALTPGSRLGPYEVLAPVGAGGMGEVYRAKDTRLDRSVAIKVLPAAVARDAERLARFEREAKVVAALNHPNIAQVYGVEVDGDARAIIMELVAGSTLATPQPIESALDYARQIAEALEAAHEKGITHRDLKPANVMVTPDGVVKILDFGLATAPAREDGADPANSPTFTMAATQAGVIMGTAGYMSPEQAAGKPVDRRSDIWSFGVVLWEMLTGAKLFEGETVSHTIADVLRAPIDFGKLPESTPPVIAELVKRCLDRNVKTRLQSIGEARIAIDRYRKDPGASATAPAAPLPARRSSLVPWMVAAAFALTAGGLGVTVYRRAQEPPPNPLRTSILPPANAIFSSISVPAISPDGKKLAFTADQDGKSSLWVRDLDSLQARAIAGTAGGVYPFWSPDSQSIGFHADGRIRRVDLASGATLALFPTEGNFYGASWSSRGVILFASSPTSGLVRIPATGGTSVPVTELDRAAGEVSHRLPWFLPDGRHFLYSARNQDQNAKSAIYVGDLDSKDRQPVIDGPGHAMYVSRGGYLVYAPGGTSGAPLMARLFDARALRATGEPFPLAEAVTQTSAVWASHQLSVAQDGAVVYASSPTSEAQLTWFDRSGKALGTLGAANTGNAVAAISPDGSTVAFTRGESEARDVWLIDLRRNVSSRFTFNPPGARSLAPAWSADGKHVYFAQFSGGEPLGVMRKAISGGSAPEPVGSPWGERPRPVGVIHCSKDGRYVVARLNPGGPTASDLWIYRLDTPGEKPRPYLTSNSAEGAPRISPGSDWLAYSSDETRRFEVYVQSFPEPGRKYQVSVNGGTTPVWSRDGKELFFIAADRKMMAVSIQRKADRLEIGTPQALFDSKIVGGSYSTFDVSADGRFLVPVQDEARGLPLTLLVNWQPSLGK